MSITKQFIEPYLSKKTEAIINGEKENVTLIDWDALAGTMGGQYNDILDYFVNDEACEDKIATGDWKPFGLLGLNHHPGNYGEMSNGGLLLFDVSNEETTDPAILLWREGEASTIAEHFSDLKIAVIE
jgi:hypothetical protein